MVKYCAEWCNGTEESGSDHHLITFKLLLGGQNEEADTTFNRYNVYKANWEKFAERLEIKLRGIFDINRLQTDDEIDNVFSEYISTVPDLDKLVQDYMIAIRQAANFSIPKTKKPIRAGDNRRTVSWWTRELTELRRQVNLKRRKYQRTYTDQALRESRKQEYFDLKYKYTDLIKTEKIKSWKDYCNSTGKNQAWNSVYKAAAGKQKSQTALSTLEKPDGTFTGTIEETLHLLMNKFIPEDDCRKDNKDNRALRSEAQVPIQTSNDLLFCEAEVKNTLYSFNPKKCPGEDGIGLEILCKVFEQFPKLFTKIYNECLIRGIFPKIWKISYIIPIVKPAKINTNTVDKFRPISLLPVSGKLLEKLLINRIMHHLSTNKLLSDKQFGFRPQKSTIDAIMEVKSFVEDSLKQRYHVLFVSMDVQGAFDAAWWPAILSTLKTFKCPRNLFNLSASYFNDRWAFLKTNNAAIKRKVTMGCPQGSCSAPGYWIIQYNSLLTTHFPDNTKCLAFADDFAILIKAKTTEELEAIGNCCMRRVEEWSARSKVTFNSEKTKVMHITWRRSRGEINLFLNNGKLSMVSEIKYLGVIFDNRLNWNKHIDYVCSKGLQLINKLSRSAKVYWGIGSDALLIIYTGAFIPLVSYAIPAWYSSAVKKYNCLKISRMHRLILLRIIKGFKTISYEGACVIAGIQPLMLTLKEKVRLFELERNNTGEGNFAMEHPVDCALWSHPGKQSFIREGESEGNIVKIYTDGSKHDASVGCAFVAYVDDSPVVDRCFRLNSDCSNNQAEQLAILKALEWLMQEDNCPNLVTIYSDSKISLDNIKNYRTHWPLVEKIRGILSELEFQRNVVVGFRWVRGHAGCEGNEAADMLAKQAATDSSLIESYTSVPRSFVKAYLANESLCEWQTRWMNTEKGQHIKKYFPDIFTRIKCPLERLDFYVTQALSGHGKNRAYLHRFHIIDDPSCPCDQQTPQTWNHIIMECPKYEQQRAPLIRNSVLQGIPWPISNFTVLMKGKLLVHFIKFLKNIDFNTF